MATDIINVLCDVITNGLDLSQERVVEYAQNWNAPTDGLLYVVVSAREGKILSNSNQFDPSTKEEVKSVVMFQSYDIDLTSKNNDALDRAVEVVMALTSQYSLNLQEQYQFRVFRTPKIVDLTYIEAASALKRKRVSVIITYSVEKRTSVDIYEHFPATEVKNN